MSSTIVDYILNLKGNLSQGIQDATGHANKLESSISGVNKMLGMMGVAFGAYEIFAFAKEGAEKFHELEQVTAKVEANLASTSEMAGMGMQELTGFAKELSGKIQASRAEVMDMQSQLLTFPAITKNVFAQSMGLVADLAKQTNHGLSETAIMYGKALNDPSEGLQKMMRYGVMFTAEEKKTIETLQASGKLIEAQKFMMEAIAHSGYAGVAEKMFNADIMSKYNKLMGNAKLATGEFVEEMMKGALPVIEGLATGITTVVHFIQKYSTQIEYLVGAYVGYKAIMLSIIAIEKIAIYWKAISAVASNTLYVYNLMHATGLGVLTSAQIALNVAMSLNPVFWVVAGIVALSAGVIALANHFGGFKNAMGAVWDFMKTALNLAINLWKALGEMVVGVLMAPFDRGKMFKQGLRDYIDSIKSAATQTQEIWNNKDAQLAANSKKGLVPEIIAGKPGKAGAIGTVIAEPKTKAEGQKTINIHVAYNAPLISGFTISTTNVKEGLGSLKEKVSAILVGATHDSLMVADY